MLTLSKKKLHTSEVPVIEFYNILRNRACRWKPPFPNSRLFGDFLQKSLMFSCATSKLSIGCSKIERFWLSRCRLRTNRPIISHFVVFFLPFVGLV